MTNLLAMENDGCLHYLASPYSKYPDGPEKAYADVCRAAGLLISNGIHVFSPIAHSHPICKHTPGMALDDYKVWLPLDKKVVERCDGVIVLMLPSWDTSYGVHYEIESARELGKPVSYVTLNVLEAAYG